MGSLEYASTSTTRDQVMDRVMDYEQGCWIESQVVIGFGLNIWIGVPY